VQILQQGEVQAKYLKLTTNAHCHVQLVNGARREVRSAWTETYLEFCGGEVRYAQKRRHSLVAFSLDTSLVTFQNKLRLWAPAPWLALPLSPPVIRPSSESYFGVMPV
jgi:hypothetical protein